MFECYRAHSAYPHTSLLTQVYHTLVRMRHESVLLKNPKILLKESITEPQKMDEFLKRQQLLLRPQEAL